MLKGLWDKEVQYIYLLLEQIPVSSKHVSDHLHHFILRTDRHITVHTYGTERLCAVFPLCFLN